MKKLKKILLFTIFTFLFQGCVLNNFDNHRKNLVGLKIKPIFNNNHLKFSLSSNRNKTLKYYSLNLIRIDRLNDCINYDLKWEYLVPPHEKISVNIPISYPINGNSEKLHKNTLYLTTVSIKKIDTLESKNMLPTIYGRVLFYIDNFGKIISSPDSEEDRTYMCMKVKI